MTARNTAFIMTIIKPEFYFRTFDILTSNTMSYDMVPYALKSLEHIT